MLRVRHPYLEDVARSTQFISLFPHSFIHSNMFHEHLVWTFVDLGDYTTFESQVSLDNLSREKLAPQCACWVKTHALSLILGPGS